MEVTFMNHTIYGNFAESIFLNKCESCTKKVLPSETTAEFVTII